MNINKSGILVSNIDVQKAIDFYNEIVGEKNISNFTPEEQELYINETFLQIMDPVVKTDATSKEEKKKAIAFLISLLFQNENKYDDLIVYAAEHKLFPTIIDGSELSEDFERVKNNISLFKIAVFLLLKHNIDKTRNGNDVWLIERLVSMIDTLKIESEQEISMILKSFTIFSLLPFDENNHCILSKDCIIKIIHLCFSILFKSKVDIQLQISRILAYFLFDETFSAEDLSVFIGNLKLIQNDQVLKALFPFYSNLASSIEVSFEHFEELIEIFKSAYYTQRPILNLIILKFMERSDEDTILNLCEIFDDPIYISLLRNAVISFFSTNDFLSNMFIMKIFDLLSSITSNESPNEESILEICDAFKKIAKETPGLIPTISESILNTIDDIEKEEIVENLSDVLLHVFTLMEKENADETLPLFIQHFNRPFKCFLHPFRTLLTKSTVDFNNEESKLILNLLLTSSEGKEEFLDLLKSKLLINNYPQRKSLIEELVQKEITKETKDIHIQVFEIINNFPNDPLRQKYLEKLMDFNGHLSIRDGIRQLSTKFLNIAWGRNPEIAEKQIIPFLLKNSEIHIQTSPENEVFVSEEEKVKFKSCLLYSFYLLLWENQQIYPIFPETHHKLANIDSFLTFTFQYE